MEKEKYVVDDYSFASKSEYERALKEKETIEYIIANTNMSDMKSILKVYNRAVEKKSFQTVIGLEFVKNMRKRLVGSGFMAEDTVDYVPVVPKVKKVPDKSDKTISTLGAEKYKNAYEEREAGIKIRNIIIGGLVVIIVAMVVITYKTKYSVFTYFTDYKAQMEEELINKYEKWEKELEKREKKLNSDGGGSQSNSVDSAASSE